MSITVFTKPNCVQCNATYRALDAQGIEYETINVSENGDALLTIKNMGYLQVPVVLTEDGDHWSGFRPDKIQALTN